MEKRKESNREYMIREIEEMLEPDVLAGISFIPKDKLDMSIFAYDDSGEGEGEVVYFYKDRAVHFNTYKSKEGMSFELISHDERFLKEWERLGYLIRR